MATNCKLYCQTRDPGLVSAAYELVQVTFFSYERGTPVSLSEVPLFRMSEVPLFLVA